MRKTEKIWWNVWKQYWPAFQVCVCACVYLMNTCAPYVSEFSSTVCCLFLVYVTTYLPGFFSVSSNMIQFDTNYENWKISRWKKTFPESWLHCATKQNHIKPQWRSMNPNIEQWCFHGGISGLQKLQMLTKLKNVVSKFRKFKKSFLWGI